MTEQTGNTTDHQILQAGLHPERLYLATMQNALPQFSVDRLAEHVQAETVYWTGLLSTASAGSDFLLTFEQIEHAMNALSSESNALKDLGKAVEAHARCEWADASNCYTQAVTDLHFALGQWCYALCKIGDDTPFDHYYGTRAEREKHQIPEPPRQSLAEMQAVSPVLFRAYQNLDRLLCLGVEVTQRQMLCLTRYLQEAEAQAHSPEA
jgi:hypothetical protein